MSGPAPQTAHTHHPLSGLRQLSSRFEAAFRGSKLAALFAAADLPELMSEGVLQDLGPRASLRDCLCERRRPFCDLIVQRIADECADLMAICPEDGRIHYPPAHVFREFRFDWRTWARLLRERNRLGGDDPVIGMNSLFLGVAVVEDIRVEIILLGPTCLGSWDFVLPARRVDPKRICLFIALGDSCPADVDHVLPASQVICGDLLSLNLDAVRDVLRRARIPALEGEVSYLCHDQDHPSGRVIDSDELRERTARKAMKACDVFVDLTSGTIRTRGKLRELLLDEEGKSTGHGLGRVPACLLASYLRSPNTPQMAHRVDPYLTRPTGARSAAIMFNRMRRSVQGEKFLITKGAGAEAGETTFAFEPFAGMKWCVLDHADR
jgi:hypothetical protein